MEYPLYSCDLRRAQGLVLGPLLFLIYIDSISTLHLSESSTLYADDILIEQSLQLWIMSNYRKTLIRSMDGLQLI